MTQTTEHKKITPGDEEFWSERGFVERRPEGTYAAIRPAVHKPEEAGMDG